MKYQTRVELSLNALTHNYEVLKLAFGGGDLVCMVKANAYGHGMSLVATHLERIGAQWLGVSTVQEGISLRKAGIQSRILVMSGAGAHFFAGELAHYELTPLVSSEEEIKALLAVGVTSVHLDLDTGMSRGGFLDADGLTITVEGVSTHFAKAEAPNCAFSELQLERFAQKLERLVKAGVKPQYLHVDKSASTLLQTSERARHALAQHLPDATFLARPGLSLYGLDLTTTRDKHGLIPVLSWRAPITLRKTLPAQTPVGYDGTFITTKETEMALVRVGYGDGLRRQLSNVGHLLVGGVKAPLIGRISMDLCALDVSEVVAQKGASACAVGTDATIIGHDGESSQSAYDLARLCDTIPYEILTSINARVARYTL